MMIVRIVAAACISIAAFSSALAQGNEAAPEIVIVGFSKPYRLTDKELRNALGAYQRGRAALAPTSALLFQVSSPGAESLETLQLELRNSDEVLPLALDKNHRFELPPLGDGKWELVANRARTAIEIRPIVLSPGTDLEHRRLGDMRLQCLVTWAIEKDHVSMPVRAMFDMAGGCQSTKMALYAKSERAIADADITTAGRVTAIAILRDRHTYRAPLGDKSLPDDATVRFRWADRPDTVQ